MGLIIAFALAETRGQLEAGFAAMQLKTNLELNQEACPVKHKSSPVPVLTLLETCGAIVTPVLS